MRAQQSREQALKQLGVAQWYSRKVLLGAKPSPVFEIEKPVSAQKITKKYGLPDAPRVASVADTSSKDMLSSLKREIGDNITDSIVTKETVVPSESPNLPQTELQSSRAELDSATKEEKKVLLNQLSFRLFKCSGVMVITESATNSSALKEGKLLNNILRACGLDVEPAELIGAFHWPVFTANHFALDNQKLNSLLKRWLDENRVVDAPLIFQLGPSFTHLGQILEGKEAVLQFDSSLMELLAMPAKKAGLWRQLQSNMAVLSGYARG